MAETLHTASNFRQENLVVLELRQIF